MPPSGWIHGDSAPVDKTGLWLLAKTNQRSLGPHTLYYSSEISSFAKLSIEALSIQIVMKQDRAAS